MFQTLLLLLLALHSADTDPRYVFVNHAPGVEWNAGNPDSFTRKGMDEIVGTINAPQNEAMRLGVSFVFDFFRYDLERVAESLERFLRLSEETGIPILVNLDGMNWWEARPDLWNWWNPNQSGYAPENRHNVEWSGWGPEHAVKIGWRNWGSQIRVLPMMNVASPQVIRAHQEALKVLLPRIAAWWNTLPQEKKHLLGGVKLGHEASIGINAWYYPDGNRLANAGPENDPTQGLNFEQGWHGGMQPIGYAAVASSGIKQEGELTREDIAQVIADYLGMLCAEAQAVGLPPEKVYTHQGGNYAPWDKTLPWWPAFNSHAAPGWSFYFTDPTDATGLGEALDTLGSGRWAAVEWWWSGNDKTQWLRHFERTFTFRDCRMIVIYNWNCGLSLSEHPDGIRALRTFIGKQGQN